uniref:Propionicin T1 n=1 Tax=Acidipropionibacterium thoenii TaxID=1751 RepID=Q9F6C4_9ACTN|nr:propionicin T1 [Acidipropionibacterium thoenii]
MKKTLLRSGTIALATAAAFGASLAAAPSAMAVPGGCTYTRSNRDVIGTCKTGSGQFRIRLDCNNAPDKTSVWAKPKVMVSVHCLVGQPRSISFETK